MRLLNERLHYCDWRLSGGAGRTGQSTKCCWGGGGKKIKSLELFKGSGSFGKVARRLGWEVVSVDLDPIYTPNIETDILEWNYKKVDFIPDFIWASPPCNTYSTLSYPLKERNTKTAEPYSDRAKIGTKILYKTLEIINYFKSKNPNLKYVIENPRGMMRQDEKMKKLPFRETTYYCHYGGFKLKPTDFWSNYKLDLIPAGPYCEFIPVEDIKNIKDRYSIPYKLIKHIIMKV